MARNSEIIRKIAEEAKKIREKHPDMKWKNCIKDASKKIKHYRKEKK